MKIHIYYGGRGLIEDSNLYVLSRITEVLEELRVEVKRYNLYECKSEIAVLANGVTEADGVILAASVEWYGIGGLLQQFLDDCWLYADKSKMTKLYMMPVVISSTYGEREAEQNLMKSWELLGGCLCPGITAYVESQADFETSANYAKVMENRAENLYRTINQKIQALPSSTFALKQKIVKSAPMELTPQESEQLSKYVSDDTYVKKQKEDIEELSQLFKGLMDRAETGRDAGQEFVRNIREAFQPPMEDIKAVFEIRMTDTGKTLVVDVNRSQLKCYYGESSYSDVVATTTRAVINRLVTGRTTFQGAFMSGELSAKGDFKTLRVFDQLFQFDQK
ncbi:MAG: SCP2 sterol-binding domain-containing protein [Lachnospiraceae bacterium]|nr:SCP2 sterol-binding domain-containing protein [Lachnospiraceae bacterium]MBP3611359.1 SCP2 sterol-binding domain-containing protein [Lachnospiraceae bacterium]